MGPNEKKLRDGYERYSVGDSSFIAGLFDENIVWVSVGAPNRIEIAGEWRGLSGVDEYYAALAEHWSVSNFVVEEMIAQEDRRFAVRIDVVVHSKATGKRVRFEKTDLVTMKNGKILDYKEIYDTAPLVRATRL